MTGIDPIIERLYGALNDFRSGKMLVMLDDEDRENEGDLVFAAQFADSNRINFMIQHARGLVCLALHSKICDRLKLPLIEDPFRAKPSKNTAFTVSIEAAQGITTGIAPSERAHTIQTAIKDEVELSDLVVPGHVFPLRAVEGGVLKRRGHTEASVELASMTGLREAAVICEIIKDDGTMARKDDLILFCKNFGLRMITVADVVYAKSHGFSFDSIFRKPSISSQSMSREASI